MSCRSRLRVNGCSGSSDCAEFLPEERDAHRVRPGLHRHARPQPAVERLLRLREVRVRQLVVFGAADRRHEDTRAVDADLQLVRPLEAGHVADDVLQQDDVEFVGGVEREVVPHEDAAARPERQAFDVIVLGAIGRHSVDRADRRRRRIADGQRADPARGGQILLEQRRRDLQDIGDVVEPVRLVVGRQERRRVDVEREHVAHGGGIFGTVQPVERRAAWVGLCERDAIDRPFERRRRRRRASPRPGAACPAAASCVRAASG